MANRMIAPNKKRGGTPRNAVVFGTISWIVDELVGIRTAEQRLSRRLEAGAPANNRLLLNTIRDLSIRVELLDRALDEYSRSRWA
jgi:hypothetical protein